MSAGLAPETSIAEALRRAADFLDRAGIEEPKREARRLIAAAMGCGLARLIAASGEPLGVAASEAEALLVRRAAREPVSRILGRREFYGLEFRLNAATLDPRPDTETLVDAVLEHLRATGRMKAPLRLLDLGTGTGALLLALLHHLPGARGTGIDIAADAVAAASANAETLGLSARAVFRQGDLAEGLEGPFDILVSNPPYIPSGEIAGLDPEVRLHDPVLALDGGPDGLDFYRRIVAAAPGLLAPGGFVGFEVGMGQAGDVAALLAGAGFTGIGTRDDLGGIARVVTGLRPREE